MAEFKLDYTAEEVNKRLGAVLPVVEIADVTAITAEESAKLKAAIGMPCIIKLYADEETVLWDVYAYALVAETAHIFASTADIEIFSEDNGETWVCVS